MLIILSAIFARHLRQAEHSPGTIENYLRHVRTFAAWLAGKPVTEEAAAAWKKHLLDKGYCPNTINAMLVVLNRFFDFVGWKKYQVKPCASSGVCSGRIAGS